jgi:clan AA aspartic protease
MLHGYLREDVQAVVAFDLTCRDGSRFSVQAVIDTGFNGQVSLSRRIAHSLALALTVEGTIEVELASGTVVEEQVYSGDIHFDGQRLPVEIILTDAEDSFIGTGLLTGKVLLINFATREVTIQDHLFSR